MTCPKCNGTGLLPFKNRRDAWVDCECKQQVEHYQPLTHTDFDFPMSDTFRAFSYQYCNQPDPARQTRTSTEIIKEIPEKVIVKHHYISPQIRKGKRYIEYKDA